MTIADLLVQTPANAGVRCISDILIVYNNGSLGFVAMDMLKAIISGRATG
jgi:hypothetical protein